jgi:hypothetical protein
VRSDFSRSSARRVVEIKMWEVSSVTFPANRESLVTDVKARRMSSVSVAELDQRMDTVFAGFDALCLAELEAEQREVEWTMAIAEDAASG